ncbi:trypsin-like serine protease [Streptomyces sp. NPDC051940]|uniref:S1 family peptidase n=1 Tax=Streptomyces sp. NPDC051940 TaxID=3155675 RepID=UPI0034376683
MLTKLRSTALLAAAAALSLFATASPASAIVGGTDDNANRYAAVGALQASVGNGQFPVFCSGTLIRPDVVLTASHCLDFFTAPVGAPGLGVDDLSVSFAVQADETKAGSAAAQRIVLHPDWLTADPGSGNSKEGFLSPGHEDIALIFLKAPVPGVTPAAVATAGYLDGLDLTSVTLTPVGYGTDAFITGSAGSPKAITVFDAKRSFRDVSVITEHDAFPDRFVKITKSVCFGDSGGPLFHGNTVVGINTWTFSYRCDGPNLEYRTDSAPAQAFLDANL